MRWLGVGECDEFPGCYRLQEDEGVKMIALRFETLINYRNTIIKLPYGNQASKSFIPTFDNAC